MIFIAHRGFRVGVAENTFNAFDKSCTLQMDYIELDVQLSKDGDLYVLHDGTLDRTMQTTGELQKKQNKELDGVKSREFDSFLPSLEKVFQQYLSPRRHPIKFIIELKGKKTGEKIHSIIEKFHAEDRVVYSGNSLKELRDAHKHLPSIPLCLNITHCPDFPVNRFLQLYVKDGLPLPFAMISLRSTEIRDTFIRQCHRFDIQALAWDFLKAREPIGLIQHLMQMGIDGLLFDDPATVDPIRK